MRLEYRQGWSYYSISDSSIISAESLTVAYLDRLIAEGQMLKHDRTTSVCRVVHQGQELVVKRYNARSSWHRIKRLFRRSRASRCWQASAAFSSAGIDVVENVAMLEKRFGILHGRAYYISHVAAGPTLYDCVDSLCEAELGEVTAQISAIFNAMAEHWLSHGDMKATNLMWDGQRLRLIDLDAASQHRSSWLWRRANNRDRRRFMKNWLNKPVLHAAFDQALS